MTSADFSRERRYAQLRAGRVAYVDRGDGPAAIFLHGYPLSAFQWRGALPALSTIRRCIAPDMLAMGCTEAARPARIDADAQAAMVVELMDRLGIDAADFVGSDSGGGIAQLVAAGHPHRVRSMLLTNCDTEICCPPPALQPMIDLARAGVLARDVFVPWWHDKELARSAQGMGGLVYSCGANPTDEALDEYFAPLARSAGRRAELHAYTVNLAGNFLAWTRDTLSRYPGPVRIVWGTGDKIFSAESSVFLAELFPNSTGVRSIHGANLFWPEEQPGIVVEEAQRLWSE